MGKKKVIGFEDERCGCGKIESCASDVCVNRMARMECTDTCAHVQCANKRFQKKEYARVMPKPTVLKGWGLFAEENIAANTFVMEYVGEVITSTEANNRILKMQAEGRHDFYHMTLDSDRIIDATKFGNFVRFLNNSCDPNCVFECWEVNGEKRMGVFTTKRVNRGEELTIDYQYDQKGVKQKCYCGTKKCTGYIGWKEVDTEPINAVEIVEKVEENDSYSYSNEVEDVCFICNGSGSLAMCDFSTHAMFSCPKVYHQKCLQKSGFLNGPLPAKQYLVLAFFLHLGGFALGIIVIFVQKRQSMHA